MINITEERNNVVDEVLPVKDRKAGRQSDRKIDSQSDK